MPTGWLRLPKIRFMNQFQMTSSESTGGLPFALVAAEASDVERRPSSIPNSNAAMKSNLTNPKMVTR